MSVCPLSPATSVLRPLALWCLDTFGEGPSTLIGVTLGDDRVTMQPIELHDPIHDLGGLAAPDHWDVVVIVAPSTTVGPRFDGGTVAHAVDRSGSSATELDEWRGRRRSLRTIRGRLHEVCCALFVSSAENQ